jgi:multisubunit Na+/H+ antiporter MnhB subunit
MIDALVLSLSNIVICSVAAVLYAAVNEFEPNRRLASALKLVIVAVGVGAIFSHLDPGFRPAILTSYQSDLAHSASQQPGCQIGPSEC